MTPPAVHPRRHRRPAAVTCLLVAVLVAGCADTTPTPAPTVAPPSPTAAASAPAATPGVTPGASVAPTPTLAPAALAPGSMAVTVSDRVRVRSQPRVADDSAKYEPLLPTGTELLVIEGPVHDSGYDWYRVAPVSLTLSRGVTDGWVAAADHDGTPWIALAEDPLAGLEFATAAIDRAAGRAGDARRAAVAINAFALDLYRRMRTDPTLGLEGSNVVFSPTSISLALAMARAGARGETAAQMDAVLRADGWKPLAAQLNALEQALAGRNATWTDDEAKTHALSLRIANAAFGQRGWPIQPAYLEAIGEAFGAGLGLLDYAADPEAARQVINAWVSRQTAKRIPELLARTDISELTRLVLVNAIYLKANWQIEFDEDATADRAFTRPGGTQVQVPTMSLWGGQEVPYATGAGWKATELGYVGAEGSTPLAMTLILPDDIDAFEQSLSPATLATIAAKLDRQRERLTELSYTPEDWADMRCGTYPYTVHLFMPRFGVETRADIVPSLKRLGMTQAMSETADFSGITSPSEMFIAAVIHQANIDVDETGTEAAAATAVVGDTTGGCGGPQPAKTITLRLNRPFLFVLHDVSTGAILFMGRVLDPSARS